MIETSKAELTVFSMAILFLQYTDRTGKGHFIAKNEERTICHYNLMAHVETNPASWRQGIPGKRTSLSRQKNVTVFFFELLLTIKASFKGYGAQRQRETYPRTLRG